MPPSEEIILYHYTYSPYARRVVWYLNLRNIPYTQCLQPPILPRPTTKAIGTSYRRIPILSIGKDIYLDTRLIFLKLNTLYPPSPSHPSLSSSSSPFNSGIEKLLGFWTVHGLFASAASLIPSDTPLMRDERFRRDREDYMGVKGAYEEGVRERGWGEAVLEVRNAFELLEGTVLADGREWIFGNEGEGEGEGPGMGDIEAIWPFHWLTTLKGALPPDLISPTHFPKVFAWISRFDAATRSAAKAAGKPKTIKGDEAVAIMRKAGFVEESTEVDESDPSGLKAGEWVEVWPTDSGSRHRDRGRLVGLSAREVVVETGGGEVAGVRVHAPRHGFRVRRVDGGKL
ncbi:glutathione s-transferase-related protein-like protein [Cadophora sp. DSE1049]|nr:glutathione s-transferase-related protein-like protein [Cadophora sp. DSE1049]